MKTLIEMVSDKITWEDIDNRFNQANLRVENACGRMLDLYRKQTPESLPLDTPSLSLPPIPPIDRFVVRVLKHPHTSQLDRYHNVTWGATDRNAIGEEIHRTTSPSDIVEAIHLADAYASKVEAIACKYQADTAVALNEYTKEQALAIANLERLVKGIS